MAQLEAQWRAQQQARRATELEQDKTGRDQGAAAHELPPAGAAAGGEQATMFKSWKSPKNPHLTPILPAASSTRVVNPRFLS